MKCLARDEKYLGAPMFLTKVRTQDFQFLQERHEAKLKGWRSKCLSWAGRSTLIKSVAQAITSYTMSIFEVPNKICDSLDALTRRFWWSPSKSSGKYLVVKSWSSLCRPKRDCGLGFRKK